MKTKVKRSLSKHRLDLKINDKTEHYTYKLATLTFELVYVVVDDPQNYLILFLLRCVLSISSCFY